MQINDTKLAGVFTIIGKKLSDERGSFSRLFCVQDLKPVIGDRSIVQVNHSLTCNIGAVRGLHYQNPPFSEMKIIRCLKGKVFDVVVDLRQGSPTFLQWNAVELSREGNNAVVIPEGCAHGFQVLEEDSELLYLHTAPYTPSSEGALRFDDPKISVKWPLPLTEISERDKSHTLLNESYKGISL